jgi:hypothetical protein
MANRTLPMNDAIHAYFVGVAVDETNARRALREATASMSNAEVQIGPEQGAWWRRRRSGSRRSSTT